MKTPTQTPMTLWRLFPAMLAVAAVTAFVAARPTDHVLLFIDAPTIEITAPAVTSGAPSDNEFVSAEERASAVEAAIAADAPVVAHAATIVIPAQAPTAASRVLYFEAKPIVIVAPAPARLACKTPSARGC